MSDQTDCTIIIISIIGLIFYLNFIKGQIKIKEDYLNEKCNPVRLFLSSINSTADEGVSNFSSCVNSFKPKTVTPCIN